MWSWGGIRGVCNTIDCIIGCALIKCNHAPDSGAWDTTCLHIIDSYRDNNARATYLGPKYYAAPAQHQHDAARWL